MRTHAYTNARAREHPLILKYPRHTHTSTYPHTHTLRVHVRTRYQATE
jgi:hypothetical protein